MFEFYLKMLLQIKSVFVLTIALFKFSICSSYGIIGCENPDDPQDQDSADLDLDFKGDIKTFFDVRITSLISKNNNKYIDARLDEVDDRIDLTIFTTDDFPNYAKEQNSTQIILTVKFACPGGTKRTLLFVQRLKEGNYFSPVFSQDLYQFIIPTPLYKGFELTMFEKISAADNDLTGYKIKFSSADSKQFNILVGTLKNDVEKKSFASLKLMSMLLYIKENIEFSIIATDTGSPIKKTASARIIISADSSNRFPPIPRFFNTVAYQKLTSDLHLPKFKIVLDPETYTPDVNFRKLLDDDDIFHIKNEENIVYVSLFKKLNPLILKEKENLSFDIEASNTLMTETGKIAVVIFFPKIREPHFISGLYMGKLYVGSNTLEIEALKLEAEEGALQELNFELEGDNAKLFDKKMDYNLIELFLKPNISRTTFVNIHFVSLKLMALRNLEVIFSTSIIIDIIPITIFFEKSIYTGSINDSSLYLDPIAIHTNLNAIDDIDFHLSNFDVQLFTYTVIEGKIQLKLNDNFDKSKLRSKNYFKVVLEAEKSDFGLKTSCVIFIEKLNVKSAITFHKNIYEAKITSEAEFFVEDIVMDTDFYNDNIEFSIQGRDAQYFRFQQTKNVINLFLKNDFNYTKFNDTNALLLEVKAFDTVDELETFAIVVCKIIHDTMPEFEKPTYIGQLMDWNNLTIENLALKMSTWKNSTLFELTGNYSNFFEPTVLENTVQITLNANLPEEVKESKSIVLVIVASNNRAKGFSTIIINFSQSRYLSNVFKKTIQKGKVLNNEYSQEIKLHDIEPITAYNVANFTCKLTGDGSNYFDYTKVAPKNVFKIILAAELPIDIIQQKLYLTILMECQNEEDTSIFGSTLIFLDLPAINDQISCTSPDPPSFIPEFQTTFYQFYAAPSYIGSLQLVNAIINNSDANVRYFLNVKNELLRSRININAISGEIYLSAPTSPGVYYFDIIAENVETKGQGRAKGRLDIEALIQCDDYVSVSNSLLIKYLEEETNHDDVLNGTFSNCELNVFSTIPDNQEYVRIDPDTKMLKMASTDMEDPVFSNMIVPQIEVKLKLACSGKRTKVKEDRYQNYKRDEKGLNNINDLAENRSLVFTSDITFSKDVTLLLIILVDINDNYPEFVYPKQKKFIIGFPEDKLINHIFPENVIQVVAKDRDKEINAKIRYSIQPNEHFKIDSHDGKIYPYVNAMKGIRQIHLIVYATDKDGAVDGLSSKFILTVKTLTAEYFVLLTFRNTNIKKIENLMEVVKNQTGMSLIGVTQACIPFGISTFSNIVRDSGARSVKFIQKIWAYGFESDIPISSKEIQRNLSESSIDVIVSAQTLEEVLETSDELKFTTVQNVAGFAAGLCIMAVIIIACIGLIFWGYVRFYRHHAHINDTSGSSLSSQGATIQNLGSKQSAENITQKHADFFSDTIYGPSLYSKSKSVKIFGTTSQESTDAGKRYQIENLNLEFNDTLKEKNNETESDILNDPLPPRATVTFNEFVERIHIESDDDNICKT